MAIIFGNSDLACPEVAKAGDRFVNNVTGREYTWLQSFGWHEDGTPMPEFTGSNISPGFVSHMRALDEAAAKAPKAEPKTRKRTVTSGDVLIDKETGETLVNKSGKWEPATEADIPAPKKTARKKTAKAGTTTE